MAACGCRGQIVVSDTVRSMCGDLNDGISRRDLGVHLLRDVGNVPLFQAGAPDLEEVRSRTRPG
jgi:class 3 adenylate cyclase